MACPERGERGSGRSGGTDDREPAPSSAVCNGHDKGGYPAAASSRSVGVTVCNGAASVPDLGMSGGNGGVPCRPWIGRVREGTARPMAAAGDPRVSACAGSRRSLRVSRASAPARREWRRVGGVWHRRRR